MFVYKLPYQERKSLCRILDLNNDWEQLGGAYMKFDVTTLEHFRQAPSRNHSPTDEMLTSWGTQNHTVLQLFILLSQMQHYQAMMVLKPLVDEKYHRLIYEGEENFSRILSKHCKVNVPVNNTPFEKEIGAHEVNGNINININNKSSASDKSFLKDKLSDKALIDFGDEHQVETHQKKTVEEPLLNEGLSPSIPYAELEQATGNWDPKNLLGKGGFGRVYKGFWKNTEVAIKRLEIQRGEDMDETYKTNRKQSLRELKCLNSCRHDNILPLYGYSIGGLHDCLVYQYMTKGSLEDRLLCREGSKPLNWNQRHSIATGTARGLQYLHTIGDKPLVHGDIKSANILLDPYLVPKIGDFGLAREGPHQQYTHVKVSRVHGTRPYLPDEFLRAKKFSTKVDTYSFGVVLFELASGLRAYDENRGAHKYLKEYVEHIVEENVNQLRDIKAGHDELNSFATLISIGLECVSMRPKDRPEMVEVLQKLDMSIPDLQPKISSSPTQMALLRHPEANILINAGPSNYRSTRKNSVNTPNLSPVNNLPTVTSSEDDPEGSTGVPEIVINAPSPQILSEISRADGVSTSVCNDLPLISALGIKTENEQDDCS